MPCGEAKILHSSVAKKLILKKIRWERISAKYSKLGKTTYFYCCPMSEKIRMPCSMSTGKTTFTREVRRSFPNIHHFPKTFSLKYSMGHVTIFGGSIYSIPSVPHESPLKFTRQLCGRLDRGAFCTSYLN